MIIIDKPYVSELLIDTIVQNDWTVLDNGALDIANIEEDALRIINEEQAKAYYSSIDYPLVYSNSENAIRWFTANLPETRFSKTLNLFKDKSLFRNIYKDLFPNFNFREVEYSELSKIRLEDLNFPLVIKPCAGFMGFGVHIVYDDRDWRATLSALEGEMEEAKKLFEENVISSSRFLIEDYIQGDEYAIDAYFDSEGNPVILNIFQHPYLNSKDVRNRIYITSAGIMVKYMARFALLLKQIGDKISAKNLAVHLELRINDSDEIIPVEINPMRFSGWCTTDVAKYAWGINVYECFLNQQKPDWNEILSKASRGVYYFSMAEVPDGADRKRIKSFNYEKFLANYSNVLEVRRINPKNNPLFAIIFGQTNDKEEIKQILQLKTKDYTIFS